MTKRARIDSLPVIIASSLFISQIIFGIYLLSDVSQIQILAYFGAGLYVFSGVVFGWLPVTEFRKKGRVEKGKSYIHTTRLVDTGIYSIIRHPQYVTFIMWSIAGMLLFQHWILARLMVPLPIKTAVKGRLPTERGQPRPGNGKDILRFSHPKSSGWRQIS